MTRLWCPENPNNSILWRSVDSCYRFWLTLREVYAHQAYRGTRDDAIGLTFTWKRHRTVEVSEQYGGLVPSGRPGKW